MQDYWKPGSDEIEPTNDETSDLEETNHDNEQEISEIFRIETNLFDYETSLCENFKEFNYLLKIDPDLLTKDIEGFKNYDEYKDDWIYEWNENVPWVHKKPWTNIGAWTEPAPFVHYCNPFNYIRNTLRYQDLEWYDALKDRELKDEALRNKAMMEGLTDEDDESSNNEGRDEKKRLDHLKQDQEMLVIKIFSERKKVFKEGKKCEKIRAKRDEEVVVGEGVVVTSSSLKMLTNSCLGGIMVSLIFLEGLEEEALVEFMVQLFEEDKDGKKNEKYGLFNLKANDQSRKAFELRKQISNVV
ncbi:hypothetical protein Tco_0987858 [Tanacetum coccineum]